MLSPVARDSRQPSGDPMTRSGWDRERASRHPRHALHGRRERSPSVQKARASRSSTKASFPAPGGPWTSCVRPPRPRSEACVTMRRAAGCPRLRNPGASVRITATSIGRRACRPIWGWASRTPSGILRAPPSGRDHRRKPCRARQPERPTTSPTTSRRSIDRMVEAKITQDVAKAGQDVAETVAERADEAWRDTRPMRRDIARSLVTRAPRTLRSGPTGPGASPCGPS